MRRSTVVKPALVVAKPYVHVDKPVKICIRPGCGRELTPRQKKYCGAICRSVDIKGGPMPQYPYKPSYATKDLEAYLKKCKEENERTLLPVKAGYIVLNNAVPPTQDGYADFLDIDSPRPFEDWALKHPEFARAMERLMSRQKLALINYGLAGRYQPVYGKLLLGVGHGMIEKKEVDNKHSMFGLVKHIYGRADEIEKERYGK